MYDELKLDVEKAIRAASNYEEQKIRLKNIANIYELSFRQVITLASSWFGKDYKKASYIKKSNKTKEELVIELADLIGVDADLCDSLTKVNKALLVRIIDKLNP